MKILVYPLPLRNPTSLIDLTMLIMKLAAANGDADVDVEIARCLPAAFGERPPPLASSSSVFTPTAANPLHAHLEALAVAAPRLLAEAPPDFRLSAVSCRIAALEEQLRQQVRFGWSE